MSAGSPAGGPAERLIFVPEISSFGGVERLLLFLSGHLERDGVPHRIVCFRAAAGPSDALAPLPVTRLNPRRHAVAEARALRAYVRARSGQVTWLAFDLRGAFYAGLARLDNFVLHLTDPPSLLPRDVSKHAMSVRRACPVLAAGAAPAVRTQVHGELVHRANRSGVQRASTVVVMTNRIAREIAQVYQRDATVVRPGVEAALPGTATASRGERPPRMIVVSRLERSKRVDWVLEALRELDRDSCLAGAGEWCLDVVGRGSEESALAARVASLGLDDRVVFHRDVPDDRLEALYRGAAVAVVPAVQGYGLPALEALARRIPVVVHADSGVSEILDGCAWAAIAEGGREEWSAAMAGMMRRILAGEFEAMPAPSIPTADAWARRLCQALGWSA